MTCDARAAILVAVLTPIELEALSLSLKVAVACTVVLAIPGIGLGWLLARRSFPGRRLVDALVHLPLVLPPVAVGYVLLLIFGRSGPVGGWLHRSFGLEIAFGFWAAVLASAAMGLPLLVRSVRLAVELVDPKLEAAAASLGASPLRVLTSVTLPLARPGVLAGLVLAFARSLGEFGATITFAGNLTGRTQTLPLALFTAAQRSDGDASALRLLLISVALAVAAMIGAEFLAARLSRGDRR